MSCEILGDIQEEAAARWASLVSREGIWAGWSNWGPSSFCISLSHLPESQLFYKENVLVSFKKQKCVSIQAVAKASGEDWIV